MKKDRISDNIKQILVKAFDEVKGAVLKSEGFSRAGLMLGLQELGASLSGFVGAYYPVTSNIIVLNKTPIRRIIETNSDLLKPYGFHVLLHEYIHSLGFLDEWTTRKKTYDISREHFGEEHIATQLSMNIKQFFPNLVYPVYGWLPSEEMSEIEIVRGFDSSTTNFYIT